MLVPRFVASVAVGGLVVLGMAAASPALATTHGTAKPSPNHQINVSHTRAPLHRRANIKAATATGKSILIFGPSLNGSPNNEETLAQAAGYSVTVATASFWDSMTTAQFASYNAIVFGDPTCGGDPAILNPGESDQTTW